MSDENKNVNPCEEELTCACTCPDCNCEGDCMCQPCECGCSCEFCEPADEAEPADETDTVEDGLVPKKCGEANCPLDHGGDVCRNAACKQTHDGNGSA